jgi:hypothetical protein
MKNKTILWAIFSLFFLVNLSIAQEQKEQNKKQKQTKQKVEVKIPEKDKSKTIPANFDSLKGFVDKNTNGIDDRLEFPKGKQGRNRKRDKFIDLNGDGICDGRESALGIKKTFRNRKGRGGKK